MKVKLSLILLLFINFLKAQNNSLSVKVTADNQALEFATVFLPTQKIGNLTDSTGVCHFKNLPIGKLAIKISYVGYFEENKQIEIKKGDNLIEIALKSGQNNLSEVVVTGTMKEMSKAQSVVPVEIYTAKFFERNPTPTLFEAMQNVNGIRPQMQCNVCNTGDIHINGMEGPYTMVLIDGMPIVS